MRRFMTKAAASLAFAAATASLAAFAEGADSNAQEPQLLKHESQESGYSLDLPLDWDAKVNLKDFDCAAFAPKDKPDANFVDSVSVVASSAKDGSLDELADAAVAKLKERSPGFFSLASKTKPSIEGCEAVRLEYSTESGGVNVRAIELRVQKGERRWTLVLCAEKSRFLARKALFDKIEASFKPLR